MNLSHSPGPSSSGRSLDVRESKAARNASVVTKVCGARRAGFRGFRDRGDQVLVAHPRQQVAANLLAEDVLDLRPVDGLVM